VTDTEHVEGTTTEEGQQMNQATSPEMTSPKTTATNRQAHVGVWASLQVAQKRWNICEVVKDARWWSWTVIKDDLDNSLVFSKADVLGKNCGLWVLDIDREICDSGTDFIEIEGGVHDLSALE